MVIIIHHANAWVQALQNYDIDVDTVPGPKSFPVLLILNTDADGTAMDMEAGKGFVTPEQAAKLLSVCSVESLMSIPLGVRQALADALPMQKETTKPVKLTGGSSPIQKSTTLGVGPDGTVLTFSSLPLSNPEVGHTVQINGTNFIISQVGTSADEKKEDTGILDISDAGNGLGEGVSLPELEAMPIDPSKFDTKQKIADLGDAQEHVLDVERSV